MKKGNCGMLLITSAVFMLGGFVAAADELPTGSPGFVPGPDNHGASSVGADPARPDTYGTSGWVEVNYPSLDFTPLQNGEWAHFAASNGWSFRSGGTNTATCTGIHLPSGANWQGISRWTSDTDATNNLTIEIYKINQLSSTGSTLYSWTSSGTPGIERVFDYFTAAETVDNSLKTYSVCIFSPGTTGNLQHAGITAWYQLQVHPAPGTATFSDVPTGHWAFQFVEALKSSGITAGCAAGLYCPDNPITRAEMAVYLSAALGLHYGDF